MVNYAHVALVARHKPLGVLLQVCTEHWGSVALGRLGVAEDTMEEVQVTILV